MGSGRAIFMLRDGAMHGEIKDFLVSQDRCAGVTLEARCTPARGRKQREESNQAKKGQEKKERDPKPPEAEEEDNRAGSKRRAVTGWLAVQRRRRAWATTHSQASRLC